MDPSRRTFLQAALAAGAGWAVTDLGVVDDVLAQTAHEMAAAPTRPRLTALTTAQAATLEAFAARIIPAVDGRPGATEAGALYFIDKSLATFNGDQKALYTDGIADLDTRARRVRASVTGFAALTHADQDAILHDVESSKFFETARVDVIVGTFALPSWGGNRAETGWRLLGFEHRPAYVAPFGYYDADANRKR